MDKILLGIDIGTTGTKTVAFDVQGRMLAMGQSEYSVSIPQPNYAEQDPEDWWKAVCDTTRKVIREIPGGGESVIGVAVSSQAPCLLPMGKDGKSLRPAMIWMDRRAEEEARILEDSMGKGEVEAITGNLPDPFYIASKLLWLKKHEPEIFKRSSVFLQVNGYINYRLTGRYSVDNAHATLLQLRDYSKDEWSEKLCSYCGVRPDQFPTILQSHERCGEVTDEAAAQTGLIKGTPVLAGTVDGAAAALEAGITGPGIVAEMTGTSTVMMIPNDRGIIEPAFIAVQHALPGIQLLLGALVSTGASLKWFRDELGEAEVRAAKAKNADAYDLLTGLAEKSNPGSGRVVFLPYMMGERSPIWHTQAKGVFFGLSLSTTKGDMVRAILEGTSYALRHNLEVAGNAGNQIKADVLGIPVLIPEASIGAPFGDAVIVGAGLGIYEDVDDALKKMVTIKESFQPDMENHKLYQELYAIYRSIYLNLREDFDKLAAATH